MGQHGLCVVVQGEALQQVQGLVQQAVGQDWRPLPQAIQKATMFQSSINTLVFDVLMDKVSPCCRKALHQCWQKWHNSMYHRYQDMHGMPRQNHSAL